MTFSLSSVFGRVYRIFFFSLFDKDYDFRLSEQPEKPQKAIIRFFKFFEGDIMFNETVCISTRAEFVTVKAIEISRRSEIEVKSLRQCSTAHNSAAYLIIWNNFRVTPSSN